MVGDGEVVVTLGMADAVDGGGHGEEGLCWLCRLGVEL